MQKITEINIKIQIEHVLWHIKQYEKTKNIYHILACSDFIHWFKVHGLPSDILEDIRLELNVNFEDYKGKEPEVQLLESFEAICHEDLRIDLYRKVFTNICSHLYGKKGKS